MCVCPTTSGSCLFLPICARISGALTFNANAVASQTVKVGITIAQGEWEWTGIYFACILLFALGTIFSLFMDQKLKGKAQHIFLLTFCVCFVLVDGIALAVDRDGNDQYNVAASLASSLAAFALGAQNLLSQKAGLIKANTTFMTGNIQKMAEAIFNAATRKGGLKPAEERAAFLLFCTWLPYILGGICGASLADLTSWSLTPVALLYAIGMFSMQNDPPKKAAPMKKAEAKPAAAASDPVVSSTPSTTPATDPASTAGVGSSTCTSAAAAVWKKPGQAGRQSMLS